MLFLCKALFFFFLAVLTSLYILYTFSHSCLVAVNTFDTLPIKKREFCFL